MTTFSFYPDTIDLQDRDAPSAKDHPRAALPTSNGSLAPHQAETIREVAAETAEENARGPAGALRSGGDPYADHSGAGVNKLNGQTGPSDGATNNMQAAQARDTLAIAQNGGGSGTDVDDSDLSGDGDDGMDDDMMDKISSSPSIEDGASPSSPAPVWPRRLDSLHSAPSAFTMTINDARASLPCPEQAEVLKPQTPPKRGGKAVLDSPRRHHHLPAGGFNIQDRPNSDDEPMTSTFDTP